jgi:hypothetical protein
VVDLFCVLVIFGSFELRWRHLRCTTIMREYSSCRCVGTNASMDQCQVWVFLEFIQPDGCWRKGRQFASSNSTWDGALVLGIIRW